MILESEDKQVIIESDGEIEDSIDMSIDQDSIGLLMSFLSKNIYSDSIGSPIRELVSNAWDANVKAGVNNPIQVKLEQNITSRQWEFSVEDTALGLDDEEVKNVISKYLKSTKRKDNTQIGAIGAGFKSPLAYKNSFTFRCRKNGVERSYSMHEGEFTNQITPLNEMETTEPNGVKVTMPVEYYDRRNFSDKIRQQLAYFSNTYITDEYSTFNNDYKIYENDLFKWSEISTDHKMHLCLGEVYYPMDFDKLGISQINIPIAVKIGLEDKINPTISRESLMLTPQAKEIILDKIKKIADWFVTKYNESLTDFKTFPEACSHLNVDYYYYSINDKQFNIADLIPFSHITLEEPKIDGISLREPKYYKKKLNIVMEGFSTLALDDYRGTWRRKHILFDFHSRAIDNADQIVVVNYTLAGNLKSYLRDKHGNNTMYVETSKKHLSWYKKHLKLGDIPKEEWRAYIQEFQFVQRQISDRWNHEFDLGGKKEYIDWLAEKKEQQKLNREKGISEGTYEGLNKQKGQITIHTAREHKYDFSVVFEKKVADISSLSKRSYLSVVVPKDINKERLYYLGEAFPKIKFIYIGEREIKHVLLLKQFMKMEDFKESKPFSRLATALLIEDILEVVPGNEDIIYETFPKYGELKEKLQNYMEKEGKKVGKVKEIILEEAKDFNNWDTNIYPEALEFQGIMRKFGFLSFIDLERDYSEEQARIAKNFIYIMLKWQKINAQLVENMELTPIPPKEVFDQQEAIITVEEEVLEHV